jgi:hypothetical protein
MRGVGVGARLRNVAPHAKPHDAENSSQMRALVNWKQVWVKVISGCKDYGWV